MTGIANRSYIEGVLRRLMVVVLLGCIGLTAGVAFGTLFSGHEVPTPDVLYAQSTCHPRHHSHLLSSLGVAHHLPPGVLAVAHGGGCLAQLPVSISAPSGRLPMGDYVLFGLLGGLSAAVGFLVPPRSSLTAMR